MSARPVYLSEDEKSMIETIRIMGSVQFHLRDWKLLERLETSGRISVSEPHGKDDNWKTVTMIGSKGPNNE